MPDTGLKKIEALPIEGVCDYHCHCDFSIDAEGAVTEYCEAALRRNLAELCFTTHFDANPKSDGRANYIRIKGEKKPATIENLAPYVDEVRRQADIYYLKGISIKLGLEFGWFEGCEELVIRLKERHHFDYMLCGIHELDNLCFCCRHSYEKCYQRYTIDEAVSEYYKQVMIAAQTGLFDTIAHLEYYLKYAVLVYGDAARTIARPYLPDVFSALKSSGTALEVNTAALRHGLSEYYPRMEIINMAKKAGVSVIYLASDAHRPEHVGHDFEMASALVPDSIRGCED